MQNIDIGVKIKLEMKRNVYMLFIKITLCVTLETYIICPKDICNNKNKVLDAKLVHLYCTYTYRFKKAFNHKQFVVVEVVFYGLIRKPCIIQGFTFSCKKIVSHRSVCSIVVSCTFQTS